MSGGQEQRIPAVVLCGGRASRLGGVDKPLLRVGSRSILTRVLERLHPQAGALAINAGGDEKRFAAYDMQVLPDPVEGQPGPLAGILAALGWAADQGAGSVLTVAGDTPFLPADLVTKLVAARASRPDAVAVAASLGHLHPVCAVWPVSAKAPLRDLLIGRSIRRVMTALEALGHVSVAFAPLTIAGHDVDPFFNVNTPDDLACAVRLAESVDA